MKKIVAGFLEVTGFLTLLGAIVASGALFFAGYWLPSGDMPQEADIIVVLGGGFSRPFYAADLYKDGLADRVYVSRPYRSKELQLLDANDIAYPREEDVYEDILTTNGVPQNAISFFGDSNLSTYEEAKELADIFSGHAKTLLIVTSSFHARRAKMIFEDLLPESTILVVATPYDQFHKRWWKDRDSALNILKECAKYIFYFVGGHYLSSDIPDTAEPWQTAPQGKTHKPAGETNATTPAQQTDS